MPSSGLVVLAARDDEVEIHPVPDERDQLLRGAAEVQADLDLGHRARTAVSAAHPAGRRASHRASTTCGCLHRAGLGVTLPIVTTRYDRKRDPKAQITGPPDASPPARPPDAARDS